MLGRDDQIVTEWLLKADQFKGELKALAKDVKAEQRNEKDLELVRKELQKTTDAATQANQRLRDSINAGARSIAGWVSAASLATSAVTALTAAFHKAVESSLKMIEAGDDWNDRIGTQAPLIAKMAEASAHLATQQEAYAFKAKLASLSIKLTAKDYEVLTAAAAELVTMGFGPMEKAMDMVAEGMIGLRSKSLKPLGVDMAHGTSLLEAQEHALHALHKRYAGHTVVLNQLQKEKALRKELEDAELEYGAALAKSGGIAEILAYKDNDRIRAQIEWHRRLTAAAEWYSSALRGTFETVLRLENAFFRISKLPLIMPKSVAASLAGLMKYREQEELSTTLGREATRGMQASVRSALGAIEADEMAKQKELAADKGGAGKAPKDWRAIGDANRIAANLNQKVKALKEEADALQKNIEIQERYADAVRDMARTSDEVTRSIKQRQEADEAAAWEEQTKKHVALSQVYLEQNRAVRELAFGGLADFTAATWAAADAAIMAGEGFGEAMLKMLKSTLLSLAQQATVKAVFNLAEAAAQWWNPYAVAEHTRAAMLYGIVAAATGGAGLAMSAAGVGRKEEQAERRSRRSDRTTAGTHRPSFGQRGENERPLVVNLYIGDGTDPGAVLIATQQLQAKLAA